MASRAMDHGHGEWGDEPQPPKRPTATQYSTRRERAALNDRHGSAPKQSSKAKAPAKPKAAAKQSSPAAKRRKGPLPRVTKQSGGWTLVIPLPSIKMKSIKKNAKRIRRFTGLGVRGLSQVPRVGMRLLSATFFFGAVAYALVPSALDALRGVPGALGDAFRSGAISGTFSPEVQRWSGDISRWSSQYGIDPNLMATVMQIESCGHPSISSSAGAQGLFQVMPFHFASHETMTDPDTNAMRSAGVLNDCLQRSDGDIMNALACYNGGPSQIGRSTDNWPAETQRYVVWGIGIYTDAQANADSATLDTWLNAGGAGLCNAARNVAMN